MGCCGQKGPRPAPQNPARVLLADLFAVMRSPRIGATAPRPILTSGNRPYTAPRIEDVRNPDDRNLRAVLVARARAIRQSGVPS